MEILKITLNSLLKCGMKNNIGIAHSNSEWVAVRNFIKMRKVESGTERGYWACRNTNIKSDFHSAEKIKHRNLSNPDSHRDAESRTVEFTQNRKNINCRTKESGMNYKVEKSTIGNNVYNSLRRNFLSEIPRIFAIFGS